MQFADDDAIRFHDFMRLSEVRSVLATVPDKQTRNRYSRRGLKLVAPTRSALERALARMRSAMNQIRKQGGKAVFLLTYSGHGVRKVDRTELVLLDGTVGQSWLEKHVLSLPAGRIHLMFDACYSQALLGARGAIRSEAEAKSRELTARAGQLAKLEAHYTRHLARPLFQSKVRASPLAQATMLLTLAHVGSGSW